VKPGEDGLFRQQVPVAWRRGAGIVVLVFAAGLTALLVYEAFLFVSEPGTRGRLVSSTVIFALMQLALCGICWQAGFRLAFDPPDRHASLFSGPAWLAMGVLLIVLAALMGITVVSARRPTAIDVQLILSFGGFGVWCVLLAYGAWKRRARTRG
jgi:hypothetical protein